MNENYTVLKFSVEKVNSSVRFGAFGDISFMSFLLKKVFSFSLKCRCVWCLVRDFAVMKCASVERIRAKLP